MVLRGIRRTCARVGPPEARNRERLHERLSRYMLLRGLRLQPGASKEALVQMHMVAQSHATQNR